MQIDLTPEVDKLSSLSGTKRSSNSGDLESAASDRCKIYTYKYAHISII